MNIITNFKAKYFSERNDKIIDMFVIHSTELPLKESLEMLSGNTEREVSCHYLVDLDGSVYNLVDPMLKAYHAGKSFWRGREALNEYSIGFELVDTNNQNERVAFTKIQMKSLIELCRYLMTIFKIMQQNIVAHSDIAPDRKSDPGENFDWELLSKNGVGIFYDKTQISPDKTLKISYGDSGEHVYAIKKMLSIIGYKIYLNDKYDDEMLDVVIAFKRRFYQFTLDDIINIEMYEIINFLAKRFVISDN
jgi:N-acetylmuramoyl-L-alanine amidase